MQKFLCPGEEVEAIHAQKRNYPPEKKTFDIISAVPLTQKGPSFMRSQPLNTLQISFYSLATYLLLAVRNQKYKKTDFGLINHRWRLVYFNTLSGRRNHFSEFQEEFSSPTDWLLIHILSYNLKGILVSFFFPSVIPLQPSTDTKDANELRWCKIE